MDQKLGGSEVLQRKLWGAQRGKEKIMLDMTYYTNKKRALWIRVQTSSGCSGHHREEVDVNIISHMMPSHDENWSHFEDNGNAVLDKEIETNRTRS